MAIKEMKSLFNSIRKNRNTVEISETISIYTKDIFKQSDYSIGEYTYGKPTVFDWKEGTTLIIGRFCSIAGDVKIFLGGNHRTDWVTTYPFNILYENFPNAIEIKGHPVTNGNVTIGNDVWIGMGATIMSGVSIGDGAVIGANAIVTKNINPYEVVIGNPGIVIRKRFDDEAIRSLVEISWWNWTIHKINQELPFLCDEKIDIFISRNLIKK